METVDQTWLIMLLAAAALHGVWLAVLLFLKNKGEKGKWLLGIAFIILSFHLLNYLLYLSEIIRAVPHLIAVFYPMLFLAGPAFYFFLKNELVTGFNLGRIHLWHLVPFILALLKAIPLYAASTEYKLKLIDWYLQPDDSFTWKSVLLGHDYMYHLTIYIAASWWFCKKQGKNKLRTWLESFSFFFLIFLIVKLSIGFLFFALKIPSFTVEYILAAIMALGIHLAGYHALGFAPIFYHKKAYEINGNGKYKTSPLTDAKMIEHRKKLISLFENEKIYLNAALKISDLATLLNIPSHYLSQILNEGMQTNFYDFINKYRIEEAKEKLKNEDYEHYSILAIGMECGFANKTTFNRTFKKITGMTPSEYIRDENKV